jgi:hypothetical protein
VTVPSRVRVAVGVLSTVVFLGIGAILLSEGHTGVASVLLAIGAFRGAWLVRELAPWD